MTTLHYRGRFAPSPTGPLHLGSMLSALGSYLQAKNQNGEWLVRIEDLDPPREIPGAADDILKTLELFGLHWDGEVSYQSKRQAYYQDALNELQKNGLLYPCSCSRKQISEIARSGNIGLVYPGTCRNGQQQKKSSYAQRLLSKNQKIQFIDALQGSIEQNIELETGDIALLRADGFYAYHLAVVVDDHQQNITEIVRGYDLIQCTPIQIYLQQCLHYKTPHYLHLPIIVNKQREKLSKQTGAQAVAQHAVEKTLFQLLKLLQQKPPQDLVDATKTEILRWAIQNWQPISCQKTQIQV